MTDGMNDCIGSQLKEIVMDYGVILEPQNAQVKKVTFSTILFIDYYTNVILIFFVGSICLCIW